MPILQIRIPERAIARATSIPPLERKGARCAIVSGIRIDLVMPMSIGLCQGKSIKLRFPIPCDTLIIAGLERNIGPPDDGEDTKKPKKIDKVVGRRSWQWALSEW